MIYTKWDVYETIEGYRVYRFYHESFCENKIEYGDMYDSYADAIRKAEALNAGL